MAVSECPECACHLPPNPKWRVGMIFECPECGQMLEVMGTEPLQLERAKE